MSKNSKNSNGANSNPKANQAKASSQAQEPKKEKKAKKEKKEKVPTVIVVQRMAKVPDLNGEGVLEMPVELFQVVPEIVKELVDKGSTVAVAEGLKLHPTRKAASAWIKACRASVKGTKAPKAPKVPKATKYAKAIYRKARDLNAMLFDDKVVKATTEEARAKVFEAQQLLEEAVALMGLVGVDLAAYETELNTKPKKEKKAKKAKAA